MASTKAQNPIKTTRTSIRLLRTLADLGGATLSEVTDEVRLTKGAVYNHLATLEELGLVVREGAEYHVSLRVLEFAAPARDRLAVSAAASERIEELAETTGEFVVFVVREADRAVVCDAVATNLDDAASPLPVGSEVPLYTSAAGRAILSQLPEAEVARIYEADDPDVGFEDLREKLKTVRAQGIALNRGERVADRYSVAAPVVEGGAPVGAISISGPKDRLNGKVLQQDLAGLVVKAADDVSKAPDA